MQRKKSIKNTNKKIAKKINKEYNETTKTIKNATKEKKGNEKK